MDQPKQARSKLHAAPANADVEDHTALTSSEAGKAAIDWTALRRRAVARAEARLRQREAAEDVAHDVLLRAYQRGVGDIERLNAYVDVSIDNGCIDLRTKGAGRFEVLGKLEENGEATSCQNGQELDAAKHLKKHSVAAALLGYQPRQPWNPEHVLALLHDIFCVLCRSPSAAVSLFTRTVLLSCFSPNQRPAAMSLLKGALPAVRSGAPISLVERRLSTLPWLASLPPEALSYYVDDLYSVIQYVLSDVSLLRPHVDLLTIAARSATTVVRGMQQVLKHARLDIIMRSKADRHRLYDARLGSYSACIDALYVAAHIPRSYTVVGILYYLHELTGARVSIRNVLDPEYVETFLSKFSLSANGVNYIDRWLSIIGLAMFYETTPGAMHHRQRSLSAVEGRVRQSPIERAGTAFAWLNTEQSNATDVIEDKVFRLINRQEAAELSVLPITLYAPLIGAHGGRSSNDRRQMLLWEATYQALSNGSPIARVGALRHLFYLTSSARRQAPDDVRAAVLGLQKSPVPALSHLASQIKLA